MAVFKRDGNWWIGFPTGNGKYRREKVGPSHALAREVLAQRLNAVAERRNFPGRVANARPFSEIADKHRQLHGQFLRSKGHVWMLEKIKVVFGPKRIGDITGGDVQKFYNDIAASRTNATANRYLALIQSIFTKATAWGDFHGDNPCKVVRKGKETPHRLRYLSREEMAELTDKAHPRLRPLLMAALLTGMRRGELLALDWANVSLDRDCLYILQSKSDKPRELPIPAKLREVLVNLGPKPSGSVFELPVIMLRRYFDRAVKDAKIAGFRFHDLRHTFASWCIMRTNDLPALQRILGHSTPAMTLRYAHLSKGHLTSEMAVFESAIPTRSQGSEVIPLPSPALSNVLQLH